MLSHLIIERHKTLLVATLSRLQLRPLLSFHRLHMRQPYMASNVFRLRRDRSHMQASVLMASGYYPEHTSRYAWCDRVARAILCDSKSQLLY
ncbi:hypothetical protein VNO77_03309 [Canavalia gladiata]|uniref:Uncharacterized protein n=1 Tax=Canavalia gladiata TaxID=3824 RepID=A0AAN9MUI5_CANGL